MLDRLCLLNLYIDTQEDPKSKSLKGKSLIREKNDFEISEIIRKSRNGKTSRELTECFAR